MQHPLHSGWFTYWTSFKSKTARGVARTGCFYVEEQRNEVSPLDCLKIVWFQSPCSAHYATCHPTVKWLLQTSMDFNPASLCSAEETLIGHWEPQTLIRGHLRSNISHWWALDLWWVICTLLQDLAPYRWRQAMAKFCGVWIPSPSLLLGEKTKHKTAPMVQCVRLRNRNVNLHSFQLVCLQNIDRQVWITLTLKAWFWAIIWGEKYLLLTK